MLPLPLLLLSLLAASASQGSLNPVLDAVVRGMSCKQSSLDTQLDCEYRVGKDLYFAIAGVGQPDAAATFYHVDWDGDFYASVGGVHGCVVIKPGTRTVDGWRQAGESPFHLAFVALKNGKVYGDWQACARAQ